MEQEIKLTIDDPAQVSRLRNSHWYQCLFPSADRREIRMHSCYLDTPGRFLSARHISLRLRRENEAIVMSVKSDGQVSGYIHQRHEWSAGWTGRWPPVGLRLDDVLQAFSLGSPAALHDEAWPLLPPFPDQSELVILCEVRFKRLAASFVWHDLQAEAALDQGWLIAGDRQLALHELEIEYLSGDIRQLNPLAERLMSEFGLRFEPRSKLSRCLDLRQEEVAVDGGS